MRKTIARLEARYPGLIEDVSLEGREDGYWLYLTPGWIRQGGPHCVHEWTARDLIAGMKEVEPCACDECKLTIRRRKRAGVDPNDRAAIKRYEDRRYRRAILKAIREYEE